ncbi:anhydro-N-acetylmuramic acid kinase [Mucilaginibacter ginsenosidivorans]|uniref:Anhydro-N-acetylmuramic acid kinase n=1 Tax=Mucilaginibacter ginsenosidivorans TaxID=398053 RepID=A0A5B8UQK4_9SPHI|nr:anhydro-N-acetylmuramic acid kinase [Mucilaginibacter ginsenosidivorans]QEC61304.1 anhydro-N-acetylmuramic acid kinase [Mucilaginibacter ginsenosidivorans]
MNQNLQSLFRIAHKPEKIGIGLMSGTSLDGLDIALCRFKGNGLNTAFELLQFITLPYEEHFKQEVHEVFSRRLADLEKVTLLNAFIGNFHGELILQALAKWDVKPADVDFIASHGQTIYHAPKSLHKQAEYPNATLQIGDGDHLAVKTGILTISDFRQKHIAGGGEGAPLALYGDVLLGSKPGEDRILLNIGGIANLTYLPADGDLNKVICTDIGPGNTLIDAACREYFDRPYDKDSLIALSGNVNQDLLKALLSHPFFKEKAPKTTGPELFSLAYVEDAKQLAGLKDISAEDLVSTLSEFTAKSIADFIKANLPANSKIFTSGGGAKNQFVINCLKHLLHAESIFNTEALDIDPDAKEAILFALLGNEALSGEPMKIGTNPAVLMGKFSFPL